MTESNWRNAAFHGAAALLASVALCGCGGSVGPELSFLAGTVTLDGSPLSDARIVFQPSGKDASPSVSETGPDGSFELKFNRDRKGVIAGTHQIRVTTSRVITDANGRETEIVERVPSKYNSKTELTYDVKPGNNQFDIKLESALTK